MPEAGRLVITVVENPTINQIAFEGNDSIEDEELTEVVQLRPRLAYSVAAAEADAQRIIDAYRAAGRYAAEVNPVIIRQPDNRVDLVFEIFEGRVTSVQRINFTGNQVFSDRRLRRVIQTNQANWLSFIFGGTTYDADRLELDRELLRQFYLERGYVDFQVLSATAELARERTGFFLAFTVSEGQRYNFGQVSVSSAIPGLDAAAVRAAARPGRRRRGLQRPPGRPGDRAHGLPGRPAGLRLRRDPAAGRQERGGPDRRHQLRAGRGRPRLHRAHRHHRQQPHPRPGDPPPVPRGRGRRLQRPRDPRGRGPHQRPRLLRDPRRSACSEGSPPGRALVSVEVEEQPTGTLSLGGAYLDERGLLRPDRHHRAQLPRPRPDDLARRSPRARSSATTSSASSSRRCSTATCWPASTSTTASAISTSRRSRPATSASSRGSAFRSARTAG